MIKYELWVTFELWLNFDSWERQLNTETKEQTYQCHDSALPRGPGHWRTILVWQVFLSSSINSLDLDCNTGTWDCCDRIELSKSFTYIQQIGPVNKSVNGKAVKQSGVWHRKLQSNDMLWYTDFVVVNKLYDIAIYLILFCAILYLLYNEFVLTPNNLFVCYIKGPISIAYLY